MLRLLALWFLLVLPPLGQAERKLQLAAAPLEPYASARLPGNGWAPQVLKAALAGDDYALQIHFMPFRRALTAAQQGQADLMLPLYWSEARARTLLFSDALGISRTALFYRADQPLTFRSLEDLRGLHIAILRGATVSPEFDQASQFQRVESTSYEQLVKMLLAGRVDALVGDEFVVRALSQRLAGSQVALRQLDPPLAEQGVYLAISRQSPDAEAIHQTINRNLQRLKDSGEYATLLLRYGIVYQRQGNRLLTWTAGPDFYTEEP